MLRNICLLVAASFFAHSTLVPHAVQAQQYSDPELLVTLDDMANACGNVTHVKSTADRGKRDLSTAEADSSQAEPGDMEEANRAVKKARAENDSAATQLASFTALSSTTDRDNLANYCLLQRQGDVWALARIHVPDRQTVKQAARFERTFAFDAASLSAGPVGSVSSFFGINESALLSGLANFLVTRADQELRIAFLSRFEKWACDSVRRVVFAGTCLVLGDEQLLLREAAIHNLRAALRDDLGQAPRTVPLAVVQDLRFQQFADKQKDVVTAAYFAGAFLGLVLNGEQPLQAIADVIDQDAGVVDSTGGEGLIREVLLAADAGGAKHPLTAVLYRLSLVARMLPDRDGDGAADWPDEVGEVAYLTKGIAVNAAGWLSELGIGVNMPGEIGLRGSSLSPPLAQNAVTAPTPTALLNSADKLSKQIQNAFTATRETFDSLRTSLNVDDSERLRAYAGAVDQVARVLELWLDLSLLDQVFGPRAELTRAKVYLSKLRRLARHAAQHDYVAVLTSVYQIGSELAKVDLTVPEELVRVASFVTAMAAAEDGEQAAAVLRSHAAPVGSYRAKRRGDGFYATVNGYLGGTIASEKAGGMRDAAVGVNAPIGIELGGTTGKGWSLGILAQILDLGALTSYRISEGDGVETQPEVGFRQVFSPGAYVIVGLKDVPLSFGIGLNAAPELRKVEAAGTTTKKSAFRFPAVFLAVDIPLFRLR